MLAIFVVTFLVFVIPMFMELLINCVAFPTEALGDQSNIGLFENQSMIESYFLSDLWIFQPYLYTICMIGIFGVTSGVLACFASACSLIGKQKFKVLILVPVYALLYVVMMLDKILGLEFDTNYFFYLKFFAGGYVNESVFFVFLGVIALFTVAILVHKMRKDELG